MRPLPLTGLLLASLAGSLTAQAVPETSAAQRIEPGYRRTPSLRNDPFRHVMIPHWGMVFSVGARGENNALNLKDVGAFILLDRDDEIRIGDMIDALGLIGRGDGITGAAQGEGGVYLGGPLPGGLQVGFSATGRGYGSFALDDQAVSLLRDGNVVRDTFSLGNSRGAGLAAAEYGVHATLRFGPIYSVDGPEITLGAGARLVRPIFYARSGSSIAGGGRVLINGDTVAARIGIETLHTPIDEFTSSTAFGDRGSGIAADLLFRIEWPTNGLAFEALVANLGSVTIDEVERRLLDIDVASSLLEDVIDELDGKELDSVGTETVDVTLPRIVRFGASAWANRILQLDLAATLRTGGDFRSPLAVDVGTTWRFVRVIPLRVGLVLGGTQGVGYSGSVAVEGRTMFLQIAGQSLGGLFRNATGFAGRFELGFFF
jgi:hypothetical protein